VLPQRERLELRLDFLLLREVKIGFGSRFQAVHKSLHPNTTQLYLALRRRNVHLQRKLELLLPDFELSLELIDRF
jgi:hypothetical protein